MKLPRSGKLSFYSEANKTFVDISNMGKKYIHVAWLKKVYLAWQKTMWHGKKNTFSMQMMETCRKKTS